MRPWHRLRHWLHWQPIEVVSEWRDTELWIGARCVICGEVSGWHASRVREARIVEEDMGDRWRHRQRGTVYEEIGHARLQSAEHTYLGEGAELVVYRGDDGKLWAREKSEFEDGRFEKIAAPVTGVLGPNYTTTTGA